jgi:hypothetical protein
MQRPVSRRGVEDARFTTTSTAAPAVLAAGAAGVPCQMQHLSVDPSSVSVSLSDLDGSTLSIEASNNRLTASK